MIFKVQITKLFRTRRACRIAVRYTSNFGRDIGGRDIGAGNGYKRGFIAVVFKGGKDWC